MIKHIKTYSQFLNESQESSQFLQTREEIEEWLDEMKIKTYNINGDLTVDVFDGVYMSFKNLTHIPVQFGKVTGWFTCHDNKLTSLMGSPKEIIGGYLKCDGNLLTSLVFSFNCPVNYNDNPCTEIYKKLGFTNEGHVEALLTLDPNPKETLEKLKPQFPERYEEIIQDKRLRIELGLESEELSKAYNNSKSREGDFY